MNFEGLPKTLCKITSPEVRLWMTFPLQTFCKLFWPNSIHQIIFDRILLWFLASQYEFNIERMLLINLYLAIKDWRMQELLPLQPSRRKTSGNLKSLKIINYTGRATINKRIIHLLRETEDYHITEISTSHQLQIQFPEVFIA